MAPPHPRPPRLHGQHLPIRLMGLIQRLHPPRTCAPSAALSLAQTLALCLSALCVLVATYGSLEHSQRAATLHRRSLRRAGFNNPTTMSVRLEGVGGSGGSSSGGSDSGSGSGSGGNGASGTTDAGSTGSGGSAPKVSESDSAALAVCLVTKVEADDPQWRDGVAQDLIEVWPACRMIVHIP